MNPAQRFTEYALDFEKTYADDDWSRLEPHFAADASYVVTGSPAFACHLEGRDAILRGLRKSVDGFDRHCERRVEVLGAPAVEGNRVVLDWAVTYTRPGAPPLRLPGRSTAEIVDGRIQTLSDDFGAADDAALSDWLRDYGDDLDPSYA